MRDGPLVGTTDGAIEFRPRSVDGFLEDLVTARGVVTGGGFSLLSEAVYLGKPVLSVPLRGQFEQLMNARYLEREGFGICAPDRRPGDDGGVPRRARRLPRDDSRRTSRTAIGRRSRRSRRECSRPAPTRAATAPAHDDEARKRAKA